MSVRRRWRRILARRRRLLAALFAGLSVLLALTAVRPAPPARGFAGPTAAVLVAARDVPAGAVLQDGDLRSVPYPKALVPAGALRSWNGVVGRRLALPLRAGEPLTDVRFVANSLLDRLAGPGTVAAPVRIADAGEVGLVRVGDRVDVLAAPTSAVTVSQDSATATSRGPAVPLASGAIVLSVPHVPTSELTDGGLVVLAVAPDSARALAGAAASARLSLVLRP